VSRPRTHYDNLKVARNAPPEVIEAAYRALAQKYHPDRNPDPSAVRVTRIVNAAYEALSDPIKRRRHDKWIDSIKDDSSSVQSRPKGRQLVLGTRTLISKAMAGPRSIPSGRFKAGIGLLARAIHWLRVPRRLRRHDPR
jgi:DnaJ-class molecular chaperone